MRKRISLFVKHAVAVTFTLACLSATAAAQITPGMPVPLCSSVAFTEGAGGNIIQRLESAGSFKSLLRILRATDLAEMLSRPDANFTLFAPCDQAFAQWPNGKLEVLTTKYVKQSKESLLNHIVSGSLTREDLVKESHPSGTDFSPTLKTVGGAYLYLIREAVNLKDVEGQARNAASAGTEGAAALGLRISKDTNDSNARSTTVLRGNYVYPFSRIVRADVLASNGVIQVTDAPLRLPIESGWSPIF